MLKTLPPEDTVWTSKENTSDVKWTLQRATPLEEVFTLSCHTTKVHELHGLCLPWECDKSVLSSSTSQKLNNVGLGYPGHNLKPNPSQRSSLVLVER